MRYYSIKVYSNIYGTGGYKYKLYNQWIVMDLTSA